MVHEAGGATSGTSLALARLVCPQGTFIRSSHPVCGGALARHRVLNNLSNVHVVRVRTRARAARYGGRSHDASGKDGAGSLAPGPGLDSQPTTVETRRSAATRRTRPVHLIETDVQGADYAGARVFCVPRSALGRPAIYIQVGQHDLAALRRGAAMIFPGPA